MNYFIYIILFLIIFSLFRKNKKEPFSNNISISVCIPCIPRDVNKLPRTLNSINNQTFLPIEVIIGLSEISNSYSKHLEKQLNNYKFPVKIVNTINKAHAGPNRNRAAAYAKGDLISFMDADDIMHHKKLELINLLYNKFKPKCIIHSYTSKIKNFKLKNSHKIFKGKDIYYFADKQIEDKYSNNWYDKKIKNKLHNGITFKGLGNITHGHPTIHRSVLKNVKYCNKQIGEDAVFLRNILKFYKNNDDTMLWLNQPLTYYIPARIQNSM